MSFNQPDDATPESDSPTESTLATPTDAAPPDPSSEAPTDAVPVATFVPPDADPNWTSRRRHLRLFQIPLVAALVLLCVQAAQVSMARFAYRQQGPPQSTDAPDAPRPGTVDVASEPNSSATGGTVSSGSESTASGPNVAVATVTPTPLATGPVATSADTGQAPESLLHGLIAASGHGPVGAVPPVASVTVRPPAYGDDSPIGGETAASTPASGFGSEGSIFDTWDIGEVASPWTILGQTLATNSHSRSQTVDRLVERAAGAAVRLAARSAQAERASSHATPEPPVAPNGNAPAGSVATSGSEGPNVEPAVGSTDAALPAGPGNVAIEPSSESEGVTLVNPATSGGTIRFLVNGQSESLAPGETRQLPPGRSWYIQFHRGGDFGKATHALSRGTHVFTVTRRGWQLVPERPATGSAERSSGANEGRLSE